MQSPASFQPRLSQPSVPVFLPSSRLAYQKAFDKQKVVLLQPVKKKLTYNNNTPASQPLTVKSTTPIHNTNRKKSLVVNSCSSEPNLIKGTNVVKKNLDGAQNKNYL